MNVLLYKTSSSAPNPAAFREKSEGAGEASPLALPTSLEISEIHETGWGEAVPYPQKCMGQVGCARLLASLVSVSVKGLNEKLSPAHQAT